MSAADIRLAIIVAVAVAIATTVVFRFRKPKPGEGPVPWWAGLATGAVAGVVYAALKYFF